jgi:hypothetical protein
MAAARSPQPAESLRQPPPAGVAPATRHPAPGDRLTPVRATGVLFLGVLLVIALAALTLHSNLRYGRYITASSLPSGAIFVWVLVLIANAPFRRRGRASPCRGPNSHSCSPCFRQRRLAAGVRR